MPLIKVDSHQLSELKSMSVQIKHSADSIRMQFFSVGSALDWDIKACSGIESSIRQIDRELIAEISCLRKMEAFFDLAITKYEEADGYLPKETESVQKETQKNGSIQETVIGGMFLNLIKRRNFFSLQAVSVPGMTCKIPDGLKSIVQKSAKKLGFLGKGYSVFDDAYQFIEHIKEGNLAAAFKDYIGVGKTTYDTVSTIEKAAKNGVSALTWKEVITGDIKALKEVKHTNQILTTAASPVKNQILTTMESVTKITKSTNPFKNALGKITKADVVISSLCRIADNISEMKETNMGIGRMIAETVGETAVDLGSKVVIGAAVAAAGMTGIPAAVVTVAAVVGLNSIASWATGGKEKDFSEWVSDAVLDGFRLGTVSFAH